jgi:catechol 2,3-dioxygenase-like lactoylglutathione lyase family enzyme
MSRVQLALNVSDLDSAVDFYSKLFDSKPNKIKPGYANFALNDPPLKLILFENEMPGGHRLNHLGVEVETRDEVESATKRLTDLDLATAVEECSTCCHANQDKVWADDPDGAPWEFYVVNADSETFFAPEVEAGAAEARTFAT